MEFNAITSSTKTNEMASTQKALNVKNNVSDVDKTSAVKTVTPDYDTFEKSHGYDAEKVNSLKKTLDAQQMMLKDKLMSMISEQTGVYNLSIGNAKFQVSDEDIEWAKKAIAEGGEFSVDTVATNIMDMAKALSNNDSAHISLLRRAVEMGFYEASRLWGGEMPGITTDTYNEVMKRFDEWENSSNEEQVTE